MVSEPAIAFNNKLYIPQKKTHLIMTHDIDAMHWADKIALEVKKRVENDEILNKVVKEKGYIVYDEKTPSGKIHIGSGRGWIIHDAIAKSLKDLGLNAKFVLSSDDMDPYDKPNKDLPKEFDNYLGMPFRNIPSPVEGYKSFADYYFRQATEKFEEFGINAEFESTGEQYIKGNFNETIKIALNNSEKIKEIYLRFYDKVKMILPFNPICEKCGKIGTTEAYEWDLKKETVKYRCKKDYVEWTEGCGYEGEISPYNGNGKLPWKVEWAAKWPVKGVICELAGKDHFTFGGSRSISIAISDEVYNFPPPYPSTRKSIGKGYEFFTVGGKKMSSSKGEGVGFSEVTDFVPANLLRYLLIATRPHAVMDFNPIGTNDVILLYERYDKTERIYFGKEKPDNGQEIVKNRRIYELAHIGKIQKKIPPQISLIHAATVIQVALNEDKAIEMLKKSGNIAKKISKEDLSYIKKRLTFAKKWVENCAPEDFRFVLQDNVSHVKISEKEKEAIKEVLNILKNKKIGDKELHEEFYNICKNVGLDTKDFFKAAYRVLINKDKGPRLAAFIIDIKEKAIEMFERV